MIKPVSFKKIDEKSFLSMREAWNELLASSMNDNLFLTWEWQSTWWRTWGSHYNLTINIIVAYDNSGQLVGIAPLYKRDGKILKFITCKELRLIGSSSGFASTVRSEYLGFICDKKQEVTITRELLSYLWVKEKWDKLILNDISTDSELFSAVSSSTAFNGNSYQRATLKDYGVILDKTALPANLYDYQSILSSSMRREVFLRRKRLQKLGKVENKIVDRPDTAIKLLNSFHQDRWGKQCFDELASEFHKNLLYHSDSNIVTSIEETCLNNKTISIAYNLDYKDKRYNIQLGFKPVEDKKISVGYVQLGASLENFFSSSKCRHFDFLAGQGKESFYKDKFGGIGYRLFSIEVLKNPFFQAIYYLNDLNKVNRRRKA